MRRFLIIFLTTMLLSGAAAADACTTCGNKNHYNVHNNYGGKGGTATAIANPTAKASATANSTMTNIQKTWLTANPTQTQQVNVGSPTIGPVTIGATTVGGTTVGPTTVGPTTVDVTVNTPAGGGTGGGSSEISGYLIQNFPELYVTIPAAPLSYNGPAQTVSHYASDNMWFKRPKWSEEMVKGIPNGGKIDDAIFEKVDPIKYFFVKDGRVDRTWCADVERNTITGEDGKERLGECKPYKVPSNHYYLGPVYCDSAKPGEKPGRVWGGCSRKLLEKHCDYAVLEDGLITQGTLSNATNQSGGVSLAGIFGNIFGFNAGGGLSNTDHIASLEEKVNLTWGCYASLPSERKETVDAEPYTKEKK